jgi:hypothetical protein
MRKEIRSVLVLVNQYQLLRQFAPSCQEQGALVQHIHERATRCFTTAALVFGYLTTSLHPDHQECLRDLESFSLALACECPFTDDETAHALDSVVVYCVALDERCGRRTRRH